MNLPFLVITLGPFLIGNTQKLVTSWNELLLLYSNPAMSHSVRKERDLWKELWCVYSWTNSINNNLTITVSDLYIEFVFLLIRTHAHSELICTLTYLFRSTIELVNNFCLLLLWILTTLFVIWFASSIFSSGRSYHFLHLLTVIFYAQYVSSLPLLSGDRLLIPMEKKTTSRILLPNVVEWTWTWYVLALWAVKTTLEPTTPHRPT